jgi:hypothetical protein
MMVTPGEGEGRTIALCREVNTTFASLPPLRAVFHAAGPLLGQAAAGGQMDVLPNGDVQTTLHIGTGLSFFFFFFFFFLFWPSGKGGASLAGVFAVVSARDIAECV